MGVQMRLSANGTLTNDNMQLLSDTLFVADAQISAKALVALSCVPGTDQAPKPMRQAIKLVVDHDKDGGLGTVVPVNPTPTFYDALYSLILDGSYNGQDPTLNFCTLAAMFRVGPIHMFTRSRIMRVSFVGPTCCGKTAQPKTLLECFPTGAHRNLQITESFTFAVSPPLACTDDGRLTLAKYSLYLNEHSAASLDAYVSLSRQHVLPFSVGGGRNPNIVEGRLFGPVLSPTLTSKYDDLLQRSSAPTQKALAHSRSLDDVIEYAVPVIDGQKVYPRYDLTLAIQQTWSLACYTSTAVTAGLGNFTLVQNMIAMLSNYVWQAKAAATVDLLAPPQHGQDDVELFVGAFTSMQFGTVLAQRPHEMYDDERTPRSERNAQVSHLLVADQTASAMATQIDETSQVNAQCSEGGINTAPLLALRHKLLPTLQDAVFGLTATPPYVGGPEERAAMCLLYAVVAIGLADTPPSLSRDPTAAVFVSHAIRSLHVSVFRRQCDALVDAFEQNLLRTSSEAADWTPDLIRKSARASALSERDLAGLFVSGEVPLALTMVGDEATPAASLMSIAEDVQRWLYPRDTPKFSKHALERSYKRFFQTDLQRGACSSTAILRRFSETKDSQTIAINLSLLTRVALSTRLTRLHLACALPAGESYTTAQTTPGSPDTLFKIVGTANDIDPITFANPFFPEPPPTATPLSVSSPRAATRALDSARMLYTVNAVSRLVYPDDNERQSTLITRLLTATSVDSTRGEFFAILRAISEVTCQRRIWVPQAGKRARETEDEGNDDDESEPTKKKK